MLSREVRATLVALAVLACAPPMRTLAAQQTGTIRGRVTEASSQRPVADVQLTVVGSGLGALTGQNGEYTISNVAAGQHAVRLRRLGFNPIERTITVAAGQTVTLDFAVSQSATQLEQLVVTGTAGAAERKTVGNSITQLNVSDITQKQAVLNVTEVLQSKTPGVTILPGSGAPGTAGEIRIRGASSISGYRPVVFIDGVRYSIDDLGSFSATGGGTLGLAQSTQVTSALNFLNPNDIESIEVIKGPAAATLYGAEAANGVIQIITKKGTRGQQKMQFSIRGERGSNEITLDQADNFTTCDAVKKAAVDANGPLWPGCQGLADNTIITDNPFARDGRALRTGDLSIVQANVRGGGDRYSFYFSGDRNTEQGVLFNSDNSQKSIRTNFTVNPNDKFDFTVNVNWQDGRLRLPIQDESANGLLLSAVRGLAGRATLLGTGNEGWRTISPAGANRYKNYTNSDRLTLGGTLNFNPFPWFKNRATVGIDENQSQAQLLFLPGDIDQSQDPDAASGANFRRSPQRRIITLDYSGNVLWKATNSIETTTSFGSQVVGDQYKRIGAQGIGIGAPDVTNVNLLQRTTGSDTLAENNSVGYYVQEQVGIKDRLFLTGAVRADDHSSFGANFDIVIYPKLSLSYIASEEPMLRGFLDAARVSTLKLRGAWGQAGRAPTAFSAPQTYTVNNVTLGTLTGSAIRTATYGNPDLKAERGDEIEVGFDAGMFGERLGIDATYYSKTTSDMLQSVGIAPSTGFIGSRLTNLGEVTNKGFELSLFGSPVQLKNFGWDARVNFSTNANKLISFGVPGKTVETPTGQAYASVQQHRPGYPLGGYWVIPPLRAADGSALLTSVGAAQFPVGDTARRYFGTSTPTREIGLSNTFTIFRYIRLYGLLDYKGGHKIFNQKERNRCQSNDNCWRTNNPAARFPKTAADTVLFKELAVYRNASPTPEWIEKADFVKLREVSVTIDIPSSIVRRSGAAAASFVLSGRNLALWSDYEGVDPEVNSYGGRSFVRVDAYALPMTRRLSAGFNIQY
ncbi:MAG TPA: SusC/RagA family TonB-linked outer membrane protein [Gemmatimonadaceae bacterium]|nr:SusC/RagA family TonB-linked outer membrane protein [Gemmatimonadaceae bacterium]